MDDRPSIKLLLVIIIVTGFMTYLALVWGKYLAYFSVPSIDAPTTQQINQMRLSPANGEMLSAIYINDPATQYENPISTNFDIKLGQLQSDHVQDVSLLPFNQEHPLMGTSSTQLATNSLAVVHHLLDLARLERTPDLLQDALDYTLAYANWDRDHQFLSLFNNNDHAVATRAMALAKLWLHYRQSAYYSEYQAAQLIKYANYLAEKLHKDSFYTYYSNHGSMQNLALMTLGVTFHALIDANNWYEKGKQRLEEQLEYLLSSDGYFLEHSFGYQIFFTDILRASAKLVDIRDEGSLQSITEGFERASAFLQTIQRDSGQLPVIGDTYSSSAAIVPNYLIKRDDTSDGLLLFDVAGVAKVTSKNALDYCRDSFSDLTMTWSQFKDHAHYKANLGAIDLYQCQTQWWRASGYVPYWHWARQTSEGWMGANAPHLSHEQRFPYFPAQPIGYIDQPELKFIRIRRQLLDDIEVNFDNQADMLNGSVKNYLQRGVYSFANVTVTIDQIKWDSPKRPNDQLQSYWTMAHDKQTVHQDTKHAFYFQNEKDNLGLHAQFLSNQPILVSSIVASEKNVLGWVQHEHQMHPTTTLKVSIPIEDNGTLVNISILNSQGQENCQPEAMLIKASTQNLALKIRGCGLDYQLNHDDNLVSLVSPQDILNFQVTKISTDYMKQLSQITAKTNAANEKYKSRFKPLFFYRIKASLFGTILLIMSLLLVHYSCHFGQLRVFVLLTATGLWLIMPLWVHFIYFR